MLKFWNSYVLWLLRCVQLCLVTVTFCDVNVVWCYVLSQYPCFTFVCVGQVLDPTHPISLPTSFCMYILSLWGQPKLFKTWVPKPYALQRHNTENSKQIFPEKELCGYSPNFHSHVSLGDLHILMIDLPILLQEICGQILGIAYILLTDTWMWKLGLRPRNSQERNS